MEGAMSVEQMELYLKIKPIAESMLRAGKTPDEINAMLAARYEGDSRFATNGEYHNLVWVMANDYCVFNAYKDKRPGKTVCYRVVMDENHMVCNEQIVIYDVVSNGEWSFSSARSCVRKDEEEKE
jgi:hypothetical protein